MIDKRYLIKNSEFLSDHIDDSCLFLYCESAKEIHLLNQTAMCIYELFDGKTCLSDIYDIYCNDIDFSEVMQTEVEMDFIDIINTLMQKGIIISNE